MGSYPKEFEFQGKKTDASVTGIAAKNGIFDQFPVF